VTDSDVIVQTTCLIACIAGAVAINDVQGFDNWRVDVSKQRIDAVRTRLEIKIEFQ
jgi:hypothetical protein